MIFTVVWLPSTQDALAEIWLNAPDRQAINHATDWVDRSLRIDPESKAAHEVNNVYAFAFEPLVVLFEIDLGDRMVRILDVWLI